MRCIFISLLHQLSSPVFGFPSCCPRSCVFLIASYMLSRAGAWLDGSSPVDSAAYQQFTSWVASGYESAGAAGSPVDRAELDRSYAAESQPFFCRICRSFSCPYAWLCMCLCLSSHFTHFCLSTFPVCARSGIAASHFLRPFLPSRVARAGRRCCIRGARRPNARFHAMGCRMVRSRERE